MGGIRTYSLHLPLVSIAMATRMYWAGRGRDKAGGWTGTSWGELGPKVLPQEIDGGTAVPDSPPLPICPEAIMPVLTASPLFSVDLIS